MKIQIYFFFIYSYNIFGGSASRKAIPSQLAHMILLLRGLVGSLEEWWKMNVRCCVP